jgi:hypothetical protein
MATLADCVGSGWRHDKAVIASLLEKGVDPDEAAAKRRLLMATASGELIVTASASGETAYRLRSDLESKSGDSWLIREKV